MYRILGLKQRWRIIQCFVDGYMGEMTDGFIFDG